MRVESASVEVVTGRGFYRPDLATDVAHFHLRQGRGRLSTPLRVAVRALAPDARDRLEQLLVRGAAADERPQVVAAQAEEAGVEAAFGRDPRARAVAAEGLRHRGDQPDLACAVHVAP